MNIGSLCYYDNCKLHLQSDDLINTYTKQVPLHLRDCRANLAADIKNAMWQNWFSTQERTKAKPSLRKLKPVHANLSIFSCSHARELCLKT